MQVVLLTLIFIRPFIASLAFPLLNSFYFYALLIIFAAWITTKGVAKEKLKSLRIPLLFLLASLLLSFSLSYNKLFSIYELCSYCSGILFILIIPSFNESQREKLILCLLLSGLSISLLAIYQYFFGFAHLARYAAIHNIKNPFALDYLSRHRAFYPFVTPNALAGYLIIILPLSLSSTQYYWYLVPLSTALILTESLGAIISLFASLAFFFFMRGKKQKGMVRIIAGMAIVTIAMILARSLTHGVHTHPLFSTLMRLHYWKDTLSIIEKSPFFGAGMGNFNLSYSRFSHNSYLQFWAETGLVGLASFIWLVAVILKRGLSRAKEVASKSMLLTLLSAAIAFLIHNCVDFTFFLSETSLAWWVILALLV